MRAINLTELDIYTCTQGHLGSLKFILEVSIERERPYTSIRIIFPGYDQ